MKYLILIAVLAALAVPGTALAQGDSVTGTGGINRDPPDPDEILTVVATSNADGSNATGTLTHQFGEGADQRSYVVTCLSVNGNVAHVGVVESGTPPASGTPRPFQWFVFQDNGVATTTAIDGYNYSDGGGAPLNCANPLGAGFAPAQFGDWSVVDEVPPPPVDTDGDGVPDESDRCPNVPSSRPSGCPRLRRPANKRDCDRGEWKTYLRRNGERRFRNQGHCLKYVKRH